MADLLGYSEVIEYCYSILGTAAVHRVLPRRRFAVRLERLARGPLWLALSVGHGSMETCPRA